MKTIKPRKITPPLHTILAQLGNNFKDAAANYGAKTFRRWIRGKGYRIRHVDKKERGEKREVHAPEDGLKAIQRGLIKVLRTFEPDSNESHGFRPKRSNLTASQVVRKAMLPGGKYTVINQDLKQAFPSIKAPSVKKLISKLFPKWNKWKQHSVTRLLLKDGKELATGSPASPTILNLLLAEMDAELKILAKRFGGQYVRYADDISISIKSHKKTAISEVQQALRTTIKKYGLKPHPKKHSRKRIGVDAATAEVVGIQLEPTESRPKKIHRKKLRAWIQKAKFEEQENKINKSEIDFWKLKKDGLERYCKYITRTDKRKLLLNNKILDPGNTLSIAQ